MVKLPSTRAESSLHQAIREHVGYEKMPRSDKDRFDKEFNLLPTDEDALRWHLKEKYPKDAPAIIKRAKEIEKQKYIHDPKVVEHIKELLKKDKKEGAHELANYCSVKFNVVTIQESDEVCVYSGGVYCSNGERIISKFIQKDLNLGSLVTNSLLSELFGYLKRSTYVSFKQIEGRKDMLCLENGILNLNTLTVVPHTPEIIFFNKLPVDYVPGAKFELFSEFLGQVIPHDVIPLMQEIMGYCLYKSYPFQKAFMFVGAGANGKTTLIRTIKALLGSDNCSAIPLHQLESNRFAASNLHGKLANLFADLSSRALQETAMFKMLTGEDLIPAEKKFKDGFSFDNYAKLIFSCNQIPRSPDDSDAFFRRWVIIVFPNQFLEQGADKMLVQKLTTPKEMSGILNFAIKGLKRLLENGDFSYSKSIQVVREEYIRKSDSVAAFVMDCIEIAPESHETKKMLYTQYADYCRQMHYPISPENTFHRVLSNNIRIEDYRPIMDVSGKKERVQCWKGIKFQYKMEKNLDIPDKGDTEDVRDVNDVKVFSNFK